MNALLILIGYALLVTFVIVFFVGASRCEDEDIEPFADHYHEEDSDANS